MTDVCTPTDRCDARALPLKSLSKLVAATAVDLRNGTLHSAVLSQLMSEAYGGTSATGAWSWRMGYDVMQAAALMILRDDPSDVVGMDVILPLARRLLTETRRSEGQIRLQQFSTPLTYAALALQAACIGCDDLVLEPSAGTGTLAMMAQLASGSLMLNEIDPFRRSLIEVVFKITPTAHDAEHIDDLLKDTRRPSVVMMNPPFSSSRDRSADRHIAAKHIIAAAKRLASGGRLVAIMPMGFTPKRDAAHWARLSEIVTPHFAIAMPGSIYRKMGTTVETQLMICDKVAALTDGHRFKTFSAATIDDARLLIETHLPARAAFDPAAQVAQSSRKTAGTQHSKPLVARPTPCGAPARPRTGSVAAPTKAGNALVPLGFEIHETPRENPPVSEIYASYAPQRLYVPGAQPHPTPLVESIAMASVAPPAPLAVDRATLKLPERLIKDGVLSEAQLEAVIMANDAHARDMPGRFILNDDKTQMIRADDNEAALPYRLGYFVGDGTGCGKGREVGGLIMTNWLAGRRRHIWVSKSATLIEDAIRDWRDLGGSPADIHSLSKWKPDDHVTLGDGILFVTYATLRSVGKSGQSRLAQLLDWVGDGFDGVIGFDEAHAMQNAAGGKSGRGETKPSQQGLAGLRLQLALPRARVLYVSATGATEVSNLAYASRLGLWGNGPEYPFPSRESFVSAMEAGGVAAMEVVARDLKTLGLYTARALSFEGVEYDILEHALTPAQIEIYDAYAAAFKTIHQNLEQALMATGIVDAEGGTQSSGAKAAVKSRFESTKQRFFNHLLMGMKAPAIIDAIERDVAEGWAAVIQIVSTGESLLKRRLETMDAEDELVEGALTPRDYVLGYLQNAFPIHAQKLIEMEDGTTISEPLRDADGNLVISREAEALRDEVIEDLMMLAPITSALDQIIWHFGEDAVAEVTGRSIRPIRTKDRRLTIEKRSASSNSAETEAFMGGVKDILVFSGAGGTGRSYHAAQSAVNQKRRRHYLLEPGWNAADAIQGLGRTHRSAQVCAPFFRVCTSDVHGEKRFTATIARRLDVLGALTKGQRETGSQGMFRAEDNLESPIARAALRGYYCDLAQDRATAMSYDMFEDWTALKLMDKEGVLLEDLPPIQRFLNRVLALPIHMQNALFEEFMERIVTQTERARAAGTLDLGVETLRGETIDQTSAEDIWTCPNSGAVTKIIGLEITDPVRITRAADALERKSSRMPMVNRASGRAGLIDKQPMQVYDEDIVTMMRKLIRPTGSKLISEDEFRKSGWEQVAKAEFSAIWNAQADALPKTTTRKLYLLTGLLLPIWKDIPSNNERIYRAMPEGQPAMIGRTLSEDGAAALRAQFMTGAATTPQQMLDVALGTTKPVDLGRGLSLTRRRVAGEARLEITGADREQIAGLIAMGCFTEIIAYQLRVFIPHGEGIDSLAILATITGQGTELTASGSKSKAA